MQNSFTESCSKGAHRKFNVQYDLQHRATEIHKHGGLLVGLAWQSTTWPTTTFLANAIQTVLVNIVPHRRRKYLLS